jgi:hypothetical protein
MVLSLAVAMIVALVGIAAGVAWATRVGEWSLLVYAAAIAAAGIVAVFRFRSVRVGALATCGFPITHVAYVAGFCGGLLRRG